MFNVRLIAVTTPVIPELKSPDELIAYAARVSNPSNQSNSLTAAKLLVYLVNHKHWSPFEMAHAVLEIETTRDIGRQILRHRSFSFQEFSQRYAQATQFITDREARLQDKKNRQSSLITDDIEIKKRWKDIQEYTVKITSDLYREALDMGIAKEQARVVLPEGLTTTKLYMAGLVRSWIHYSAVRMDPSTQKEHRDIATACWNIITDTFPSLKEINYINTEKKVQPQRIG